MERGKRFLFVVVTVIALGLTLSLGPAVSGHGGSSSLFLPIITRAQQTLAQLVRVEDNVVAGTGIFVAFKVEARYPEDRARLGILDTATSSWWFAEGPSGPLAWPGAENLSWVGEKLLMLDGGPYWYDPVLNRLYPVEYLPPISTPTPTLCHGEGCPTPTPIIPWP